MKKTFLLVLFFVFSLVILPQGKSASKALTFPFLGKLTASDVNVRSGPHTNFEIMGKLKKDRAVVVMEKREAWLRIKLPKGFPVFVHYKFVQIESNSTSGIITSNRVNLRARPDANSTIITQLNKGDIVHVRGKVNDWFKIMPTANSFAWVSENFIEYVEPFSAEKNIQSIKPEERKAAAKTSKVRQRVQKPRGNLPLAEGVVMDSGRLLNKRPLHKLIDDKGRIIYYLDGDKRLLDSFSNSHVAIWGDISNEKSFDAPVIRVQKIHILE